MKKIVALLIISSLFLVGCAETNISQQTQHTQLQIREFQTRIYDTTDQKMVMKAILNVLQDDGFIIKNVVPDVGLISAEKSVDVENKAEAFWSTFLYGVFATWKKAYVIESTVNVSEYGNKIRVRANFQAKLLDNKNGIKELKQIDDEKFYQEFFAKVDKGIFIQKEKL